MDDRTSNPDNMTSADLWSVFSEEERADWAAMCEPFAGLDASHWTLARISVTPWSQLPEAIRASLIRCRDLGH